MYDSVWYGGARLAACLRQSAVGKSGHKSDALASLWLLRWNSGEALQFWRMQTVKHPSASPTKWAKFTPPHPSPLFLSFNGSSHRQWAGHINGNEPLASREQFNCLYRHLYHLQSALSFSVRQMDSRIGTNCTSTCLYKPELWWVESSWMLPSRTVVARASGELAADCSISHLPVGYLSYPLRFALDFGGLQSMPQTHISLPCLLAPTPVACLLRCRLSLSLSKCLISLHLSSPCRLSRAPHYFTISRCLAVEAQARHWVALSGGAHTCPAAFDECKCDPSRLVGSLVASFPAARSVCCQSPRPRPKTMQTCAHSDKRCQLINLPNAVANFSQTRVPVW